MKEEQGGEFRFRKRLGLIVAFSLMFHLFIYSSVCLAEMAVIPMQYRSASEALPMIQKMLSKEGRAAADTRTNQLLVIDHPESIQRVREFLNGFDRPVKQARIRVRFQESGSVQDRAVSGDVTVSGKDWSVTTGGRKGDGAEVRLRDRERVREGSSEFFVNVVSGSWAYIMVGEDIFYSEKWIDLCRRYAYVWEEVAVHRIETGFEVRPIILGNNANIEVMPRISRRDPVSKRGVIRFSSAATSLYVPFNQWVDIGGTDSSSNEVIREILGAGRERHGSSLSISLMVESPS